jgi:hypothetical protein
MHARSRAGLQHEARLSTLVTNTAQLEFRHQNSELICRGKDQCNAAEKLWLYALFKLQAVAKSDEWLTQIMRLKYSLMIYSSKTLTMEISNYLLLKLKYILIL